MVRKFVYKVLTQAILVLAWLRNRWQGKWAERRVDRTFYVKLEPFNERAGAWRYEERWHCCDCDLCHIVTLADDGLHLKMVPHRPKGYDYRLRLLAGKPSPFVDERGEE